MYEGNDHLVLNFQFRTGQLAMDFAIRKDNPKLTSLYNLLSAFGAEVRPLAKLWDKKGGLMLNVVKEKLTSGPHAAHLKRQVTVFLPHDGNLKPLMLNLRFSPEFNEILDQKSLKIDIGSCAGYFLLDHVAQHGEQSFIPPIFPPENQGFNIR